MAVREALITRGSLYYFANELRFDFDENGTLEFIEFLGGVDGKVKPKVYGVSAFDAHADELYAVLRNHNGADIVDNEDGYTYVFQNISVGIHRDITPNSINESLQWMKCEGISIENYNELENDKRRANHWTTIGLGVKGYYLK